nr:tripeptidyl-peptidase sed1 [Quercus suber]
MIPLSPPLTPLDSIFRLVWRGLITRRGRIDVETSHERMEWRGVEQSDLVSLAAALERKKKLRGNDIAISKSCRCGLSDPGRREIKRSVFGPLAVNYFRAITGDSRLLVVFLEDGGDTYTARLSPREIDHDIVSGRHTPGSIFKMLYKQLLIVSASVAVAFASPIISNYVLHEKRAQHETGWAKVEALDRRALLPMRIGLTQRNLDKGYQWLEDVSHPESEKYGKHWSPKEVAEAFAPSTETVEAVKAWLHSAGIDSSRTKQSQGLNWLEFEATVDEAEELLKTEYYVFEHDATDIDFVYPTVHFDAKLKPRDEEILKKRTTRKGQGWPGSGSLPKIGKISPLGPFTELEHCDTAIVPNCLRALYEFPPNVVANRKNSYGIVEYTPQAYVPHDLDTFFKNYSKQAIGTRPILDSIDGGLVQQDDMSFDYNGESNLDLEYAIALVYPQAVTLYQGGDDPNQDGVYPDTAGGDGTYDGPQNCGGFAATKVISTSYGYDEHDFTPFYEQRQCNEYMKLGLLGVSVLYTSGDYGVSGNGGQCIDPVTGNYNDGSSGLFSPGFPATCPYVSTIGATQVKPKTNVVAALASGTQPEMACETVIYSGGGFSNVFPMPSYQSAAVKGWFKNHPPPYGAERFNNSQQTRGYPDISANGANYLVAIDNRTALVYGTSASSPTFGSILTLVNQQRLSIGKSSIGFINPVAYAHPYIFNDITEGGNQGCGTAGFSSAPANLTFPVRYTEERRTFRCSGDDLMMKRFWIGARNMGASFTTVMYQEQETMSSLCEHACPAIVPCQINNHYGRCSSVSFHFAVRKRA